jgi:hypothetical protein
MKRFALVERSRSIFFLQIRFAVGHNIERRPELERGLFES